MGGGIGLPYPLEKATGAEDRFGMGAQMVVRGHPMCSEETGAQRGGPTVHCRWVF